MSGIPRGEQLTPYARVMHQRWSTMSAQQTVQLRREEDRRAVDILGATAFHLGFLDAIYRTTPEGEPLYGDPVGAQMHPQDAALVADIAQDLKRRLQGDEVLVCPLGIGNHVDHVIVRQAAESLGVPLRYVADFPYVIQYPETVAAQVAGLESGVEPVSEGGVSRWVQAVEAYGSQVGAVFGEVKPREMITKYWEKEEGIRLWRRDVLTPPRPSPCRGGGKQELKGWEDAHPFSS